MTDPTLPFLAKAMKENFPLLFQNKTEEQLIQDMEAVKKKIDESGLFSDIKIEKIQIISSDKTVTKVSIEAPEEYLLKRYHRN